MPFADSVNQPESPATLGARQGILACNQTGQPANSCPPQQVNPPRASRMHAQASRRRSSAAKANGGEACAGAKAGPAALSTGARRDPFRPWLARTRSRGHSRTSAARKSRPDDHHFARGRNRTRPERHDCHRLQSAAARLFPARRRPSVRRRRGKNQRWTAISFHQTGKDPFGKPVERDVDQATLSNSRRTAMKTYWRALAAQPTCFDERGARAACPLVRRRLKPAARTRHHPRPRCPKSQIDHAAGSRHAGVAWRAADS